MFSTADCRRALPNDLPSVHGRLGMSWLFAALLAAAAWSLAASRGWATTIAADNFDRDNPATTPLVGSAGGTGFSNPWEPGGFNASQNLNYVMQAGSLPYQGSSTSGESVTSALQSSIAGVTRGFNNPLGAAGTTCYLSAVLQADGVLDQGAFEGFFGLYLDSSTGNDLFMGKPGAGAERLGARESRRQSAT